MLLKEGESWASTDVDCFQAAKQTQPVPSPQELMCEENPSNLDAPDHDHIKGMNTLHCLFHVESFCKLFFNLASLKEIHRKSQKA